MATRRQRPAVSRSEAPLGVVNAEYLAQPRLKLLDDSRRLVRVQNAPPDARRRPPRVLQHWHAAAPPSWSSLEPVAKYHDRPNGRDIDYVVSRPAGQVVAPGPPLCSSLLTEEYSTD